MVSITPELVLSVTASILFTAAFILSYFVYRERTKGRDVWFFFGLTTIFAAILAYTHVLCAGVVCLYGSNVGGLPGPLLDPDSIEAVEAVMVLLASAFGFTSLYTVFDAVMRE
ncbi:MAG: hypothetical protein SV186_02685 [Candidatus Nanohaloarchaea archaeon]|nr:hypothetical protein [Candidatus Nanohaloarchaea archaeon]